MKRRFLINLWLKSGSQIGIDVIVEEDEIDELLSDLNDIEEMLQGQLGCLSKPGLAFPTVSGRIVVDATRVEALRWNDEPYE